MIFYLLVSHKLFPEEQKGCHKGKRRTGDLSYVGQNIFKKNKARRENVAMMLIDYKKAYDIIPQSWIIHCLKMYEIPDKVLKFHMDAMKNWKELSASGKKTLAEVKITIGIFQVDALLPLLFVIAMTPFNHIPKKCTRGYKFTKLPKKIGHLMYIDNINLFVKKWKQLKTDTNNEDIQPEYRN